MKPDLSYIVFEVTSVCNLRCCYCYNIWKRPDVGFEHFNSYKNAKKSLKKLFSVANVNHVTFTGGEPFLAERFAELVLFTRLQKKTVSVISNGNTSSFQEIKTLIDFGVNLFEFPLHSANPEIHDSMTCVKGSWEKTLKSIKFTLESGGNVVPVVVITKLNCEYISETLEFINNLGLKRIMLNRYNIGGESVGDFKKILPSKTELQKAYKSASISGYKHNLQLSSNVCTPFCILNPTDYPNISFSSCSSDVSKRPLTLDINGNLRFCNHSPTVMGNIFSEKIENILNSEKTENWENTVPDFCKNCSIYTKCLGGCRAASEQLGHSVKEVDPIIANILK